MVASAYQNSNIPLFLALLVVFDMIAFTYGTWEGLAMVLIGAVYALIALSHMPIQIVSQAILFGLLSEANFRNLKPKASANKNVETYRDVVQILVGLLIIGIFFVASQHLAELLVVLLMLAGYAVANVQLIGINRKMSSLLLKFEREYTKFGQGAVWLAMGTIMTIGFVGNVSYLLAIFTALFIGDAVATIAGINFKSIELFYNKKKSVLGLVAYFMVVSVIGYFFVGKVIFAIAFLGAVVESLPIKVDDNFSVPIVLIILVHILSG